MKQAIDDSGRMFAGVHIFENMQKGGGKRKKQVNLFSQEGTDITTMKLPGKFNLYWLESELQQNDCESIYQCNILSH